MKSHLPVLAALSFLVFCIFSALPVPMAPAGEPGGDGIDFLWAFGVIRADQGNDKVTTVTRDTVLASGDRLKMYVEPRSPGFFYLFYLSSQGELVRLFPPEGDPPSGGGLGVYIPEGNRWFFLDEHPGLETFYLLASLRRLVGLEALFDSYQAASDPASKKFFAEQVVAEIRKIRRSHRDLTAAAERPVSVGGRLRGVGESAASPREDLAALAIKISGAEFYCRTFTIDHR